MALSEVIGQDKAVNILLRSIERGRVSSAYLFAGESGTGKKLTALNFAKAINCRRSEPDSGMLIQEEEYAKRSGSSGSADACNTCESCRKTDLNRHPDVLVIGPEKGEIRIEEIRAVEEMLSYMPLEGRRKVVIIDESDAMNQSASNAFLKTLEEPPDKSLLILIAESPYRLSDTILSRCTRINFSPLSYEDCRKVIERVSGDREDYETELINEGINPETMVRLCMGRPGLVVSSGRLNYRNRFMSLLESMLNNGAETWNDREEIEKWLDMSLIFVRDMAMIRISGSSAFLFNDDIAVYISDIGRKKDIKGIITAYSKLSLLRKRLDFNLNKSIAWNYTASIMKAVAA